MVKNASGWHFPGWQRNFRVGWPWSSVLRIGWNAASFDLAGGTGPDAALDGVKGTV